MRRAALLRLAAMLLLIPVSAQGEDKRWSDVAEFSYVDTGGNTDVQTMSLNNTLKYGFSEDLTGTWNVKALTGETDGERTAKRYSTALRLSFKFSDRFYTLTEASWFRDRFAGIDDRYVVGVGLGYALVAGPKHSLNLEAGLSYTAEDYLDGAGKDDNEYAGGRLFAKYAYNFTERNVFSQFVEFLPDFSYSDNYMVNAETALVSALNSFLSLKTSYTINHDNVPVEGNRKRDTKLAVTLVVNF